MSRTEAELALHGPAYTRRQVMELLHLRDEGTLRRWAKRGDGPPFIRLGAKHARVLFPRAAFWEWLEANTYSTADEADEASR